MRDRFQPAAWLAAFIAARPGLRPGSMFGRRAAFVGRHLLACAWDDALVCRLPPDLLEAALRQRQAVPFKVEGRPMSGWIMYRPDTMTAARALEPTLEVGARALAERSDRADARKARSPKTATARVPAPRAGCACGGSCGTGAKPARASRASAAKASTPSAARRSHSDQRSREKPVAPRTRRAR